MSLTHANLVSQVEEDTGRSDKSTEIGKYVNRAQVMIVRDASVLHHDFACMKKEKYVDTVDGQKTYTFPPKMKSFYDLRICESGNKQKLHTLTPRYQDLVRSYPEGNSEGLPTYYIPWGTYFELSPIPNDAYAMYLRCLLWPTDMATGATSELLYMDEVIIKCADWLTVLSLNLEKDIRRFKAEYRDMLNSTISSDRESHKYDITLKAQPFVSGISSLEAGALGDYWKKPSWMQNPM